MSKCHINGCANRSKVCDPWICSVHWKMACPVGSPERRAWNRVLRLRRKTGEWTPDLVRRFWVVWRGIVRRGNRRLRGDVDMGEINKLFGWGDGS